MHQPKKPGESWESSEAGNKFYKKGEKNMINRREAVIVAYGRAPVAKAIKGSFKDMHPVDYAAQTLRGVLDKVPQLDPLQIGEIIVGCARPFGVQTYNVARLITQRAGLPDDVAAHTVNLHCASGLEAIATCANAILAGQEDVMVAGGVEDMTKLPSRIDPDTYDKWLYENKPGNYLPMGLTAENVAAQYNVTRMEMEAMAVESHRRAAAAQEAGAFDDQIIPIIVPFEDGSEKIASQDEGIRKDTNMEVLAGLAPCFKENGTVTAGTSSQMSDSAAFMIIMSSEKAGKLGLKPIAKFVGFSTAGVSPEIMGIGPIKAVPKVMRKTGLSVADMDVIELNEAFAAQAIPCMKVLGMDPSKVNPNGGALALGHPMGATGVILTCKALSYLKKNGGKYALVTMCIGGGMGAAGIFEMTKN